VWLTGRPRTLTPSTQPASEPLRRQGINDVEGRLDRRGGIEGASAAGWSAKVEYLYIDLGKLEQTVTDRLPP